MADNSRPLVTPGDLIAQVHYNYATGAVWVTADSKDPLLVLGLLMRGVYQVLSTRPVETELPPR